MSLPTNFNDILRFFEKDYDTAKEDNALSARGQFLQLYPLNHLKKMTLDDGNDSNLLIVFYVQIMPDDFVMQLHRF